MPKIRFQANRLTVFPQLLIFQPQKKKRDKKKGKGGDADEDEDDDVMVKLKNLSVEASDEEVEPVIIASKGNKKKVGNKFAALIQGQSDEEEDADLDENKPAQKVHY